MLCSFLVFRPSTSSSCGSLSNLGSLLWLKTTLFLWSRVFKNIHPFLCPSRVTCYRTYSVGCVIIAPNVCGISVRDPSAFSLRTLISHQINEMSVALDMKLWWHLYLFPPWASRFLSDTSFVSPTIFHTEESRTTPLWVLSLWKDTCNEKILCSQLWKIPGKCSG